jgi:hypothetical protein
MMVVIIGLLALWLLIAGIGIAIKGLLWLGIVGLLLFALTTVFAAIRAAI